ncbi:MAG: 4Fe-4S dicluster domain-containing protein [Treponema sp.]|nr:4Fe-4S dicluster domain-containing protein [Treponema sp.]
MGIVVRTGSAQRKHFPLAVDGFLPASVVVPLTQEARCRCTSTVEPGQVVQEGDVIARPLFSADTDHCALIHAPVPGVVDAVVASELPDGKQDLGIKIRLSGRFSYLGKHTETRDDWQQKNPDALVRSLAQNGVVNTFSTAAPQSLAYDIVQSREKKAPLLLVRLFDESPSRLTDLLLYETFPEAVMRGVAITARALRAHAVALLYDRRHRVPDFSAYADAIPYGAIPVDTRVYPSGLKRALGAFVRSVRTDEPFIHAGDADVYVDVSTMLSVCTAIADDTPVVRRYITVEGDCLPAYGLINVTLGMSIAAVAEQCGGFIRTPTVIIINGLMTGTTTPSLDTPITKSVKSISFLSAHRVYDGRECACIGCGDCRRACPYHLAPDILYEHASGWRRADALLVQSAALCVSCGLCNAVCPARLPIAEFISLLLSRKKET